MRCVTRLVFCALTLVASACSPDRVGVGADLSGAGSADFSDGNANHDGGGDGPAVGANSALLGVWQISGTDARGAYTGQLELRAAAGATAMIRVLKYNDVTVENGRELWWAWTGTATPQGNGLTTATSLLRADFILNRDNLGRTDADKIPLAVAGTIAAPSNGTTTAHFVADGLTLDDTLTNRTDSAAQPIFAIDRTSRPVNDAPSAATKSSLFALYNTYQTQPKVAPYMADPAFQAGVLDVIIDKTDFDFYQARPLALRVVNKTIDAISLGETLSRASAYGQTLAQKAAYFDTETPITFIDPVSGQLADSQILGKWMPSGDGALWTACYVASQAFRYLQTQDATALANVVKSVVGIQILMEIVPDQTTFARTLRPASGNATNEWHAGTGLYTAYDWMEGGNNDMFKGLFYGTLTGYMVLCDPVVAGQEALCARMRVNAKHLSDLSVVGSQTDNNYLMAKWLSGYANGSIGDLLNTVSSFTVLKAQIEQADFQRREMATADWSGTHLGFVQLIGLSLLSDRAPLPGTDTKTSINKGIGTMRDQFQVFRMGLWSVLFAKLAPMPSAVDVDDARWRLREMAAPKIPLDVDHRVATDFVMSPYPLVPWKLDWTTNDRTQSLHGYPHFEMGIDVYLWRSGPFEYSRNTSFRLSPGADYLHAYWLGRHLGLFTATE